MLSSYCSRPQGLNRNDVGHLPERVGSKYYSIASKGDEAHSGACLTVERGELLRNHGEIDLD